MITYNIKRPRITNLYNRHHDKEKETSLNIYVGLKLYSTVRSRTLIDCLFQLGICISYDRILSITKSLYEALRTTFGHYKIFLPTDLKKGCFTVSANYNIDKNATANLVQSHFHGTGISLFQLLDDENQGESLNCHGYIDVVYSIKKLAPLPAEYTQARKFYRSSEELFAPPCRFNYEDLFEYPALNLAKTKEQQWLQQFASFADSAKS